MPLFDKIFGGTAKGIVEGTGHIIDKLVVNDQEKLNAKKALTEVVMNNLSHLATAHKEVLKTELSGTKLQRNWRPIVMLSFAFIIVYHYFLQPLLAFWWPVPMIQLPTQFWGLLELGLGGYVIGRSVEKVATTVTENVDISFLKKRDRKRKE